MTDESAVAVIVAAGQGTRMGGKHNKLLLPLGTRTILEFSLEPFLKHPRIRKIFLTVASQDRHIFEKPHQLNGHSSSFPARLLFCVFLRAKEG